MSKNNQSDMNQSPTIQSNEGDSDISSESSLKMAPPFFFMEHLRRFACEEEKRRPASCEIIFLQSAYQQIVNHLKRDTSREHGGILMGYESKASDGHRPVVIVVCGIPAEHTHGNLISLTFTIETWKDFQLKTDSLENNGALKLKRLGWYHSHPGHGIFLSRYDIDVCSNFSKPNQLALVVDPLRDQGGFFARDEEGYHPNDPQGFWEFPDREKSSVITWGNMEEIKHGKAPMEQSLQECHSDTIKIGKSKSPAKRPNAEGIKETPQPSELVYISAATAQQPAAIPIAGKDFSTFWGAKWLLAALFAWPVLLFGLSWLFLGSQLSKQNRMLERQEEAVAKLDTRLNSVAPAIAPPAREGPAMLTVISPTPNAKRTPEPTQTPQPHDSSMARGKEKEKGNKPLTKSESSQKENQSPAKAASAQQSQGTPGQEPPKKAEDSNQKSDANVPSKPSGEPSAAPETGKGVKPPQDENEGTNKKPENVKKGKQKKSSKRK